MTLHSYPWYPADWLGSETRARLTQAGRNIYREMLDFCWKDGSLSADHATLIGMIGCTRKEFEAAWKVISCKFEERGGRLFNERVDQRRPDLVDWREARREAGRKGGKVSGEARSKRSKTEAQLRENSEAKRSTASVCFDKTAKQNEANAKPSSSSSSSSSSVKPTPPPSAREPREGEPDPAQAVRDAVERCSQFWPKIGNKRYAEAAWTREALESVEGIVAWAKAIVATAEEHAEGHLEALAKNPKHFIPTLERWVSEGDYTSPPPGGSRSAEKARLRDFNEQQRIKTLREVAANTDPEDWAMSARRSAIRELQTLGLEP